MRSQVEERRYFALVMSTQHEKMRLWQRWVSQKTKRWFLPQKEELFAIHLQDLGSLEQSSLSVEIPESQPSESLMRKLWLMCPR